MGYNVVNCGKPNIYIDIDIDILGSHGEGQLPS